MGDTISQTAAPGKPWLPATAAPPIPAATPESWLVEFRIDPGSCPYLADHGFHDMVVLPGSFHIELVRSVHRDLFHRPATSLHHITFERPVILADTVTLAVRAERVEGDRISYALFEAASDELRDSPTSHQSCARMEVDLDPAISATSDHPVNDFSGGAGSRKSATEFYGELRRNGNQYGPGFQVLAEVSYSGSTATGRLSDAALESKTGAPHISPPLLDAAPQLLAAFALPRGQTFILKSIDGLVLNEEASFSPCLVTAITAEAHHIDDDALTGVVQITDSQGSPLCKFSGVALAFIDRPAFGNAQPADELPLCVASTFTAEPLEDSLRFWGEQIGRPVRVEFAPYNQVFQQLLDPASAFHRNKSGVNMIVLGLDDWVDARRHTLPPPDAARASECFGARSRTVLPNGLEIVHLNRYETDYVYQEIFVDESYLRHEIQLADGATVIDIGANIGLFSLFVMSRCADPAIYAFEPSPRVFDLLRANCAAYGNPARVHAFNRGVADKKGTAAFTFYEQSSVFSSFHPDEREDRAAVEAVVRNVLEQELDASGSVPDADVRDLTADRLRGETIECQLTSVSDIIRENGLQRIHLLKIDAEKSELAILRGIDEEHWPLIDQIVMEVHDRTRAAVTAIVDQLNSRGFRCGVVEETLLEDSGLFNIYATRQSATKQNADAAGGLQRKAEEFCTALDSFAPASSTPLILAVAPALPGEACRQARVSAEEQIAARAGRHPQVQWIGSHSILRRYPVRRWYDTHTHQLGHMPYTPEGYAAIGTALSRALFQLDAPRIKVIALDCDNTLWQGQCGEDGPDGIAVPPRFRVLQEFMVRQCEAGRLIVLCSKNSEADVMAVFERRTEMPLRREHLAAWQINWQAKPDNLRALAAQLNLGLDSFVFIDDNPVECAAVRAGCPEVTVLQLPADGERIPDFLENLWIMDGADATREDRERTQWYRNNAEREDLRAAAPTLQDFLDSLQLRIEVREPADDELGRVAQLTLRTNQFNLSSIRRSESEVRELLRSGARCLVTSVSDRFGDYGLVGATLYTSDAGRCTVDTMLLSCRALGKGVEHRMIAALAQRAVADGQSIVVLPYRATDRNEPARAFLAGLAPHAPLPKDAPAMVEFPAARLAELRYAPEERAVTPAVEKSTPDHQSRIARKNLSATIQRIGAQLSDVASIVAAMESARRPPPSSIDTQEEAEAAGGDASIEKSLTRIWKKALGRSHIGSNENFFDAGGTSLKAVVVVAMIRKELKKNISIVALFESPTIALLAARLDESKAAESASEAATSAESRGRQRRNKLVKRRVA